MMKKFRFERRPDRRIRVQVPFKGIDLINSPLYNKGSAFTLDERDRFELEGLLPSKVTTLQEQAERMYRDIMRRLDPLHQHTDLVALQNRNEILFYKVLSDYLEDMMPIIYTPTVGRACQEFSHIFRKVRGLWITPEHKGRIQTVLSHAPYADVRLIVVTDNERILGLGDQGAGGIAIPVGKLALYTVIAGFHPSQVLAISLDVGTDNEELLNDPLYLGYRDKRLRGDAYLDLVEEFVAGVKSEFPLAILQWEDFKFKNAFELLNRYLDALPSFNDDIQGTAAVTLASLMSASRITGRDMKDQRILVVGAGAAGLGISEALRRYLAAQGMRSPELYNALAVMDVDGIVCQGHGNTLADYFEVSWPDSHLAKMGIQSKDLLSIIRAYRPTALIGISGQGQLFKEEIVQEMQRHHTQPIIFPLSNPTSKAEATPEELRRWTRGKAIVATGSPFPNTTQTNNVYIYPGVGLGAAMAKATRITDLMFFEAARVLAQTVTPDDLAQGRVLPPIKGLRNLTSHIAQAVTAAAQRDGVGRERTLEEIESWMWVPDYPDYFY